jgi:hypothetical protein
VDAAAGGSLGWEAIVPAVRQVGDVDVQRGAQEDRASALQVRRARPEPSHKELLISVMGSIPSLR